MDGKSNQQQSSLSKIYNNSQDNPQKYSPLKARKKLSNVVRVQIINQDLEQAVLDVKNATKNSYWKQNIDQVCQKYRGIEKIGKKKLQQPLNTNKFQPILCTENYKRKFEQRLQQIKEKRMQLQVKSIEKQMKAKLYQKIKQNTMNKQKMQLLRDINQKKREIEIAKSQRQIKKKSQQQFIHSCNEDRFTMLRKNKQRLSVRQLKESRTLEQQSWKNMKFQSYLGNRQSQQRHKIVQMKQQFLIRTQSQGRFRSKTHRQHQSNGISNQSHRELTTAQNLRSIKISNESQDLNSQRKHIQKQSEGLQNKETLQQQVPMAQLNRQDEKQYQTIEKQVN